MTFRRCSIRQYKANSDRRNRRMPHPMSTFPDRFKLDGRTALITGSGRGLGWEIAKGLAEAGAKVVLHGRSRERLAPRIDELKTAGHAARALCFDMAHRTAMRTEMATAGPVDILVHNVRERAPPPFHENQPAPLPRLIDAGLDPPPAPLRPVVPR